MSRPDSLPSRTERARIKLKYGTPWLVNLRCDYLRLRSWLRACGGCGRRFHDKKVWRGGGGLPKPRSYCDGNCAPKTQEDAA